MDIRDLTPAFAVSPMIDPEDLPDIAAAGFTTLLCNRPDPEVPPSHQSAAMRRAAEAAGLAFVVNPLVHGAMTPDIVAVQRATVEGGGKTLAYCASGTRSTVAWLLGAAEGTDPETLLDAARRAGYDLGALHPQLVAIHARGA
jgi:uncharacterized protein (TIGR01244 family)